MFEVGDMVLTNSRCHEPPGPYVKGKIHRVDPDGNICFVDFDAGSFWLSTLKFDHHQPSAVDRPAHYGNSTEIAELIEKHIQSFCLANAAKYLFRSGKKDPTKEVEDLQKAVFYIQLKIKLLEGGNGSEEGST